MRTHHRDASPTDQNGNAAAGQQPPARRYRGLAVTQQGSHSTAPASVAVFDSALAGHAARLELADGRQLLLPLDRWRSSAAAADGWMLDRCDGPTIDLGCGPGRLVAALVERGVPALGVDHSDRAEAQCRARGAPITRRDVFDTLPAEGQWHTALLADGNIGIGGDPFALLCRVKALLARGGSLLVETAPPPVGLWRGRARLRSLRCRPGPWFPWALLGLAALADLAQAADLRVIDTGGRADRCFAQLAPLAG